MVLGISLLGWLEGCFSSQWELVFAVCGRLWGFSLWVGQLAAGYLVYWPDVLMPVGSHGVILGGGGGGGGGDSPVVAGGMILGLV